MRYWMLLLVLLEMGCFSKRATTSVPVLGHYTDGTVSVTLDSQTFRVSYKGDMCGVMALRGYWQVVRSSIVFSSDYNEMEGRSSVKPYDCSIGKDSIEIQLWDHMMGEGLPFGEVVALKDSQVIKKYQANYDGIAAFPIQNANKLKVSYVGYKTIEIDLDTVQQCVCVHLQEHSYYYPEGYREVVSYREYPKRRLLLFRYPNERKRRRLKWVKPLERE